MKGWNKIFLFTFRRHVVTRGWLLTTLIVAILFLAGISGGMLIYEVYQNTKAAVTETDIREVYVLDCSGGKADFGLLNLLGDKVYNAVRYSPVQSREEAADRLRDNRTALILDVGEEETAAGKHYTANIVRPAETDISKKDAKAFKDFLSKWYVYILIQKSGLNFGKLSELTIPVVSSVLTDGETQDEDLSNVKEVMNVLLPYIVIMLIYLLVLVYGQGVAYSAITEKMSKLMDFFLIAVKPASMMLGKVLALALAGLLQLLCWIAGAAGGFALGAELVRAYNPGSTMPLLRFLDILGEASGIFSAGPVAVAALVIIAGFLLYCSLAAIGGSMASKTEDLQTTNMLFTLILVASFFVSMYGGGLKGGMVSKAEWLIYVPFTAVLVTPTRLILGEVTMAQGLVSLALILLLMLLAVAFAGRVYALTAFWRGNPPKLKDVIEMMKKKGRLNKSVDGDV